jgi:hypothetical protein
MNKLLFVSLLLSYSCFGQTAFIRNLSTTVSIPELKKNLYYLASDKLEGRQIGTHGDTLTSVFIAKHFRQSGLAAPFDNGKNYFQTVMVNRRIVLSGDLSINKSNYKYRDGWLFPVASMETMGFANVPIVFAGYGIDTTTYNDFRELNVRDKAVILLPGQPVDASGNYLLTGTLKPASIPSPLELLQDRGAALAVIYRPSFSRDSLNSVRLSHIPTILRDTSNKNSVLPSIYLSEQRVNEMLAAIGMDIKSLENQISSKGQPHSIDANSMLGMNIETDTRGMKAPNVIGVIKGSDPGAGCIIVSAHHDHNGKNGNTIYYGAVDNASGTVAIMEIARLMNMAVKKGQRPKRSVVFASYTGEEEGLVGSHYLADHPIFPLEKTWGVLNIDMVGRVDTFYSGRRADSMYAYVLVKDSVQHGIRSALLKANQAAGNRLKLDTYYEQPPFMQRRLTGSDQYPFYQKGVPFVRIDCGFSKDYHQPTDTPGKINYPLLQRQVQLAFLTAWNMANDE